MNDKEKYKNFYESVKRFVLDTKLSFEDEIMGETPYEIEKFEKDYQVKLPSSIYNYLLLFGKQNRVRKTELEQFFTLSTMKKATEIAIKGNYKEILNTKEGLQDYNGDDGDIKLVHQLIDLNKLVFINQSDFRDGIGFVDYAYENPNIHYLFQKEYYWSENKSITNYFRDLMFLAIQTRFYSDSEDTTNYTSSMLQSWDETQKLSLYKLSWAKLYVDNKDFFYRTQNHYRKHRLDFYEFINKQEEKTGYIMTIDEFEWAFIDYLRKQGYEF